MLEQLRAGVRGAGRRTLVTARQRARLALFGMVQREAMMLSFTDIFRWLALLFLAMLPLLLLMRSPAPRRGRGRRALGCSVRGGVDSSREQPRVIDRPRR